MVFSRLRQNLSWSSRNFPEEFSKLKDAFPNEKPEKLDQALKDARGNYQEAVQSLNNATQTPASTSLVQQHPPRKLQRPAQRQDANPYPKFGPHHAVIYPNHQPMPFQTNSWNNQYATHASSQYQPSFAPLPPHLGYMGPPQTCAGPTYVRSEPLTPTLQQVRDWPSGPMPVPPYTSPFQPPGYHQHPMPPWTPHQPAGLRGNFTGQSAVPLYEMPPPDLMDYDMGYMLPVRLLPEWSRWREETHWDQVRRERNAALRRDLGEDRDECTIM